MCDTPFYKQDQKSGEYMSLPCGKCAVCITRRASQWSFRLMNHYKHQSNGLFITLTYESPPMTKNGFMTLKKEDLQLFFKRLRKINKEKISYYAVGEYGSQTERPHYHLIIFNTTEENCNRSWNINGSKIGIVHAGTLTEASVGYTLKYLSKPNKIPKHANDDRLKEFSLMSKKIGANYLTPAMILWHKNDLDNRMYVPLKQGQKISLPRYYKDKIYTQEERQQIAKVSKKRTEETIKKLEELHGENFELNQLNTIQARHNKIFKNRLNEKL